MNNDHYTPGRYLAITGEGVAYWFDFPAGSATVPTFTIKDNKVWYGDTKVTAEWYYLNRISAYHTLEKCVPESVIKAAKMAQPW